MIASHSETRESDRLRDQLIRALTRRYGQPIVEDGWGVRRLDWPCPNCDSHPASPFSVYPVGYGRDIARCSQCGKGIRA